MMIHLEMMENTQLSKMNQTDSIISSVATHKHQQKVKQRDLIRGGHLTNDWLVVEPTPLRNMQIGWKSSPGWKYKIFETTN